MNKMTEEEILNQIESDKYVGEFYGITEEAIQGLLDLYNKRKETMKSQEKIIMEQEKQIQNYKKQVFGDILKGNYISKDKIKDLIKELEENIKNYNEASYYDPFYNTDYIARVNAQIIILKGLLKEGDPNAK